MKFFVCLLALTIILYLGQTQAQCPNAPQHYSCSGAAHSGSIADHCRGGVRWWYNSGSGTCASFYYNGCGGNNNRYCSLAACQQRCAYRG
ncbi:male accessory gland serine protease inhibitor-like [Rhagoletis pomonella]|uniref:male accessory gland serine protease inhibitor-like n=1 Tax=Rhagoletis pomonella TaxID=28610 RepID=UPI00178508A6|nr:male accessory gland serine protease inhibitor-like [Rhagoletis pomonella]